MILLAIIELNLLIVLLMIVCRELQLNDDKKQRLKRYGYQAPVQTNRLSQYSKR